MAKTKVIIKKVKEGAYKGNYVVPLSNGDYLLETGEVLCKKNNLDISNTRNVPKAFRDTLSALALKEELIIECKEETEKISKRIKTLSARINVAERDKKKLIFDLKVAEYMNKPLPEKVNMSCTGKPERLNKALAIAIIRKSDKPCYYRYGFAYRGAEKRPVSRDYAESIVYEEKHWLDFECNEKEILVNEFSDNDMW